MADLINSLTAPAPTPPSETKQTAPSPPSAERATPAKPPLKQTYQMAAETMLPRWLEMMDPVSWLSAHGTAPRKAKCRSADLLRRQAATYSIAALCDKDPTRPDRDYLRQRVQCSLVEWQTSLRSDGQPVRRRPRPNLTYGATLYYVLQTLTETVGFQTPMLIADIERHINWIARCNNGNDWLEACTICALIDGSSLIRKTWPLRVARERLNGLLATQLEEGWFDDHAGVDIGRLSLTIDALARIRRNYHWTELDKPIDKALRFMTHFIHPDGSTGGCYNAHNTTFMSPAGIETLAIDFEDAARLAFHLRRKLDGTELHALMRMNMGTCAVLGAGISAAQGLAENLPTTEWHLPCAKTATTRFPQAGLVIVSMDAYHAVISEKKGGAIHVTWRNGQPLDDPGVGVLGSRSITWSGRLDARTRACFTADGDDPPHTLTRCTGILRRSRTVPRSWCDLAKKALRKLVTRLSPSRRIPLQPIDPRIEQLLMSFRHSTVSPHNGTPKDAPHPTEQLRQKIDWRRLTHDYFQREITTSEQAVRITDRVACRIGCHTLVLQMTSENADPPLGGQTSAPPSARPTLFVEGGRRIQAVRTYRNGLLVDAGTNDAPMAPET